MTELSARQCVPCQGGIPPMTRRQIDELLQQLDGWSAVGEHHLTKEYPFLDFVSALAFTNKIGALAEEQGHHPDIYLTWGLVRVDIWTHKIDGLTESDFVLAAKIDRILGK
ncbi:MAG: 4a-hydroxytetrahydrobiopterin dehydratase [Phycisphaerales bacterium]|nr:MAG: 4a-hydroxytetrahydrobiopterin dehydratase [Phycisphaerales bacterium]